MKFVDAKNDTERFEVLRREIRRLARRHPEIDDLQTLRLDVGTESVPLPGDELPDGTIITRSALEAMIEEAAAQYRAENRLESRVRDLVADAIEARDAARLKIRSDFHARWSSYWKCGRCGGPLVPGHAVASALGAKTCPHGDHEIVLVNNGYSWVNR